MGGKRPKLHIKKGDTVIVMRGKDAPTRNKDGKVVYTGAGPESFPQRAAGFGGRVQHDQETRASFAEKPAGGNHRD